jgi:acyl carrier protein
MLKRADAMNKTELLTELTDIFRDVFMRDDLELKPELTAKDVPGWDSFKQIEIIIAAEEKFKIKFHTKELDRLHNVGDLVQTILSKTGPVSA